MKVTRTRILAGSTLLLAGALLAQFAAARSETQALQDRQEPATHRKGSVTGGQANRGQGIEISKTASVDGQNVCGAIRITNRGGSPSEIREYVDFLEVHFPRGDTPPVLPAGSTSGWFVIAYVPIDLPDTIPAGETVSVDYCFPLCSAARFGGANSMRNVVTVGFSTGASRTNVVTTRSDSFPPPVLDCQACCLADGSCTDTLPHECESAYGIPKGLDTDCATTLCLEACCMPDGSCSDETREACQTAGGSSQGVGTTCATANTSCRGACCDFLRDPACFNDYTKEQCEVDHHGTFLGIGTTCESAFAACPTGACCGGSGNCYDFSTDGFCSSNGTFLGVGTTCATANTTCRGACCDFLSDPACRENRTKLECDGTLLLDTSCESAFAACPTGACCGGSGNCYDFSTGGFCNFNGTFLGVGTTCGPSSCTVACCFGTTCQELSPAQCTAQGGQAQAQGTGCPNIGPTPCDASGP